MLTTTFKKKKNKRGSPYLRRKVKILNQLGIFLDDDQMKHILELKSDAEIDAYAHDLIMEHDFEAPHPKKPEYNTF